MTLRLVERELRNINFHICYVQSLKVCNKIKFTNHYYTDAIDLVWLISWVAALLFLAAAAVATWPVEMSEIDWSSSRLQLILPPENESVCYYTVSLFFRRITYL